MNYLYLLFNILIFGAIRIFKKVDVIYLTIFRNNLFTID
jgi:hypothetical protein